MEDKRNFLLAFSDYEARLPVRNGGLRLETQGDGKHVSGRFTRWALQFTRLHSKILRRLLRGSDHCPFLDDAAMVLQIASSLPNGTRLIRWVVGTVTASGGSCWRKKPGRLSCPIEVNIRCSHPT